MVKEIDIENCLVELNFTGAPSVVDAKASFVETGVTDSLGITSLVAQLERQFGTAVPDRDLLPDNFDSISAITANVNARKSNNQLESDT